MSQKTLSDFERYGCPDCEAAFDTHRGLSIHHTKKHDGSFGKTVDLTCDVCGKGFEKYKSRVKRGDGKYCSPECRHKGIRTGEHRECKHCGNEFYRPDCHLDRERGGEHQGKFCSPECHVEFRVENGTLRGSNHGMFKGGHRIVDRVRTLISDVSWDAIADQYRERVDVCEKCGEQVDQDLDVHHIVPLSSGGTNGSWNLMALCRTCHFNAERYIEDYTEPHLLKYAPD